MASITASSSIDKMSVASDTSPSNGALLMPKLQFRFRVAFSNFGAGSDTSILTRQVIDITRPNLSFAEIALPVYNSTVKLAGKHTWADVTVNLRDDAAGGISKLVGEQLQKQLDFMEQASAATGQDYKFVTFIEVLDGGNGTTAPVVLETWELLGCFLKTANYNTLNYGTSEAVTIQLAITYDNAIQQAGSAQGVGTAAGALIGRQNVTGTASGTGTN